MGRKLTKNTGTKDARYNTINVMLKAGGVKNFAYIFKFLPKTVVAKDMGITVPRCTTVINRPDELTLAEIRKLAQLFDYDFKKFLNLIAKEV